MRRILIIAALGMAACSKDVSGPPPAPPCTPGGPSSLALPVGGVAILSDPQSLACVLIPAAPSATSYLFVAANALPKSAGPSAYRVEAALESPTPQSAIAGARATPPFGPPDTPTRDRATELRLRAMERRLLQLSAARTTAPARAAVVAAALALWEAH